MTTSSSICNKPKELLEVKVKLQKDVVKQDQYRLNYDKLTALNNRMETNCMPQDDTTKDVGITSQMLLFQNSKARIQADKEAEDLLLFPKNFVPIGRSTRGMVVSAIFANEMQQLKAFMEKMENLHMSGLKARDVSAQITQQLEKDYVALFREFEDFQSAIASLIQSEANVVAEKITQMESENNKIKSDFGIEKAKLQTSIRELQRDKSCNECEIRTLRDELDENREKLQEKSILCDSLTRELDLAKFKIVPEYINETSLEQKASLEVQLKAAQSRNSFLEGEIQTMAIRNVQDLQEFENKREEEDAKMRDLKDKIHNLELSLLHQREEFDKNTEALNEAMTSQQSHISDIEQQLRVKEDENQEIMINAQNQVKKFVQESMETMHKLEIEKQAMLTIQDEQNKEFATMRQNQDLCSDRISAHQQLFIRLCKDGISVLDNLNGSTTTTDFGEGGVNKMTPPTPLQDSDKHSWNELMDKKLFLAESMLRKLMDALQRSRTQLLDRIDHFQTRISELENSSRLDKLQHAEEVGKLQKKCKRYGRLIRKLRSKISNHHISNIPHDGGIIPTPIYTTTPLLSYPYSQITHPKKKIPSFLTKKKNPVTPQNSKNNNKSSPILPTIEIPSKPAKIIKTIRVHNNKNKSSSLVSNSTSSTKKNCIVLTTLLQAKHEHFQHILKNVDIQS